MQLLDRDPKVWLFPFFSVGVNLFFIALLKKYQDSVILNPLFQCVLPPFSPPPTFSFSPLYRPMGPLLHLRSFPCCEACGEGPYRF